MSIRPFRIGLAVCLAVAIAGPAVAQTAAPTTPKAAATAAKPAAAAATKEMSENDQKKACDVKWKDEKARTKATGWKPYFVFMAACL